MVTHLTTNPPVQCLYMAERTGSLIFIVLWSYVQVWPFRISSIVLQKDGFDRTTFRLMDNTRGFRIVYWFAPDFVAGVEQPVAYYCGEEQLNGVYCLRRFGV